MDAGNTPVRLDSVKIHKLGQSALLGSSGAQGLTQRVHDALKKHENQFSLERRQKDGVANLSKEAGQVQKDAVQAWNNYPNTQPDVWTGICAGWSKEGGWLYEHAANGGGQFHDAYCSCGSAYPFAFLAMASVAHYNLADLTLAQGKALAFRAIETTCSTAAFGVGLPVQMGVVTEGGAHILGNDELEAIRDSVNIWKAGEVEAIGVLAAPKSEVVTPDDVGHEVEGLDPPTIVA